MSGRPTPETDDLARGNHVVPTEWAEQLEIERNEAREALSDWENAALHVEADHPDEKHCGCVPVLRKLLTDALKERDEWAAMCGRYKQERDEAREDLEFRRGLYKVQEEYLETARRERDEARKESEYWQELYRTVSVY